MSTSVRIETTDFAAYLTISRARRVCHSSSSAKLIKRNRASSPSFASRPRQPVSRRELQDQGGEKREKEDRRGSIDDVATGEPVPPIIARRAEKEERGGGNSGRGTTHSYAYYRFNDKQVSVTESVRRRLRASPLM